MLSLISEMILCRFVFIFKATVSIALAFYTHLIPNVDSILADNCIIEMQWGDPASMAKRSGNQGKPQVVAFALMQRLHVLCIQLFLTILHVISVNDLETERTAPQKRMKEGLSIAEIEAKMLRHVTSSQLALLRPVQPRRSRRSQPASKPPSPQLFAISEEE